MMRFKYYFSSLILLVSMCVNVACSDDDDPVVVPELPDLKLKTDLVEIAADGGDAAVAYLVSNPIEGASLEVRNNSDWISKIEVKAEEINFVVAANPSDKEREAELEVVYPQAESRSFTVRQAGSSSFSVERTSLEVSAEGGNQVVAYSIVNPREGLKVEAKADAEWISEVAVNEAAIVFFVAPNEALEAREGKVVARYGESSPVEIRVKQVAHGASTLHLETERVKASADGGHRIVGVKIENPIEGASVAAKAAVDWIANLTASNNRIEFDVVANKEFEPRTAQIVVNYPHVADQMIEVEQDAAPKPVLGLEKQVLEVAAEGGAARVAYAVDHPIEGSVAQASTTAEWISIVTATESEITFEVARNTALEVREAVVKVEYPHAAAVEMTLRQVGAKQPVIMLNPSSVDVAAAGGAVEVAYTIENAIEGEIAKAHSGAAWIEQLTSDGQKISFVVAKNPDPEVRTAKISVRYTNAAETVLTVNQAAGESNKLEVEANGVKFTMIRIAGATFQMGGTEEQYAAAMDETPVHEVTLSEYYMGQYEVTQELWEAVMGSNPSSNTIDPQLPVEQVSWDDCQVFIGKLNTLTGLKFALPTEAQWEYAARGGEKAQNRLFAGSDFADEVAWYDVNANYETHPVGQLAPNELGLYDMSGNVYEWCFDYYGDYTEEAQTDPQGVTDGWARVLRGGSYYEWTEDKLRVSARHMDSQDYTDSGYGLRLALTK